MQRLSQLLSFAFRPRVPQLDVHPPYAAPVRRICIALMGLLMSLLMLSPAVARADEIVHFPSLDTAAPTQLDGHLFRAAGDGRHPAIVFLHGCNGLLDRSGAVVARESAWAARFNALGVTVLMVDSFTPRQHQKTCAAANYDAAIVRARPYDAYGALLYLQQQDFVVADRVGLMGWSAGGGSLLGTIRAGSRARPALPAGDFRAAVAFYPARCNPKSQGASWDSPVPLLVLVGDSDVWTPAPPCSAVVQSAVAGTQAAIHLYAGAYHDFDWPGMPVHSVAAFRTRTGVVPIEGTNPAAREDALQRAPSFLMTYLSAP